MMLGCPETFLDPVDAAITEVLIGNRTLRLG
jgi:hypothetical protein